MDTTTILHIEGFNLEASDDNEPRIRDIDLAERLGYERPRTVRDLIKRMIDEQEILGISPRRVVRRIEKRGAIKGVEERAVEEYWLDEDQALLVCMRSNAPRAAEVRRVMIKVFREAIHVLDANSKKEQGALDRVLALILSPKPADWERMFPDSLVRKLSKLDGIPWDGGRHPRHLGKTNRKIYDAIFSSAIGAEIKRRNPNDDVRHHQHLSPQGREFFAEQLRVVETIANQSGDKADFWIRMEREYAGGMLQLAMRGLQRGQS